MVGWPTHGRSGPRLESLSVVLQNDPVYHVGALGTVYNGQRCRFCSEGDEVWRLQLAGPFTPTVLLLAMYIFAFYSTMIFSGARFSDFQTLLISCVSRLVNSLGAFSALWTLDTLGKRSWLLSTLPIMTAMKLATGLRFIIAANNPAPLGLLAMLIYLFGALYSHHIGLALNTHSAEVFRCLRAVVLPFSVRLCQS